MGGVWQLQDMAMSKHACDTKARERRMIGRNLSK